MSPEDVRIAAAIKDKDEEALESIMEAYSHMLTRMAYLMLNDLKLAEDAVQETFIKLYYHIDRYRGEASLKTYICKILVNECRQKQRGNWLRRTFFLEEREEAQPAVSSTEEEAVERLNLTQAIARLEIKDREVLLLHYYNDLPIKEICGVLGQPDGTVKSRLKRAREKLKSMLREEDWPDEKGE